MYPLSLESPVTNCLTVAKENLFRLLSLKRKLAKKRPGKTEALGER